MAMEHNRNRDHISKSFADLTALLEDATSLATAGQSHQCTLQELTELTKRLWPGIIKGVGTLANIERLIADSGES